MRSEKSIFIYISAPGLDSVKRSGRCYVLKSRPKERTGRHAIFIFQVFFLGKKMPCGAGETAAAALY